MFYRFLRLHNRSTLFCKCSFASWNKKNKVCVSSTKEEKTDFAAGAQSLIWAFTSSPSLQSCVGGEGERNPRSIPCYRKRKLSCQIRHMFVTRLGLHFPGTKLCFARICAKQLLVPFVCVLSNGLLELFFLHLPLLLSKEKKRPSNVHNTKLVCIFEVEGWFPAGTGGIIIVALMRRYTREVSQP